MTLLITDHGCVGLGGGGGGGEVSGGEGCTATATEQVFMCGGYSVLPSLSR